MLIGPSKDLSTGWYSVADDGQLNDSQFNEGSYSFVSQQALSNDYYINSVYYSNRHYFSGKSLGCISITRKTNETDDAFINRIINEMGTIKVAVGSSNKVEYDNNRFILNYSLLFQNTKKFKFPFENTESNIPFNLYDFEYIPNIVKATNRTFKWTDGSKTYTEKHPDITYGKLKTSKEWINGGKKSKLINKATGIKSDFISTFIPNDEMTANDVYEYTKNSHITYTNIPNLNVLPTTYKFVRDKKDNPIPYIKNPLYKPRNYPLETYDWVPTSTTSDKGRFKIRYKTASEIWDDLILNTNNSKSKKYDTRQSLTLQEKIFDNLPVLKEEISIADTKTIEKLPEFNYLDINTAEIVYKNGKYYIFIAFSNKLYIVKTNNFDTISGGSYLTEIKSHNIRLSFENINSLRIYENDLYITDSKLNAVIHYDLEHLFSEVSETKEDSKSLDELLIFKNILQGDGTIKNKIYFNEPSSLAISENKVYVVDKNNKCIKIYNRNLNYIKTIKNGKYSTHDIQAININPNAIYLENGTKVKRESLWVLSKQFSKLYISIYNDEELVYNTPLSNIMLENNDRLWEDNVKNIVFSYSDSNYYYICTSYNVYRAYTSNPKVLLGGYKYKLKNNDYTINQRCFALCGKPDAENDYILNIFNIYDSAELESYTAVNSFNNLSVFEQLSCVSSFAIATFHESTRFISTLTNKDIPCETDYIFANNDDYINALTINKMIYSLVANLYNLKNSIIGTIKTVASNNNIVSIDDIQLDTYYKFLEADNIKNYFVYDNELVNVSLNRIFESIYNMQYKIIEKMQSLHRSFDSTIITNAKII